MSGWTQVIEDFEGLVEVVICSCHATGSTRLTRIKDTEASSFGQDNGMRRGKTSLSRLVGIFRVHREPAKGMKRAGPGFWDQDVTTSHRGLFVKDQC